MLATQYSSTGFSQWKDYQSIWCRIVSNFITFNSYPCLY